MGKKKEVVQIQTPIRKLRKDLFNYFIRKGQTKEEAKENVNRNMEKAANDESHHAYLMNMLSKRANKAFDIKTVTYEEMIAKPEEMDDLVPVPVYINMDKKIRVDTSIEAKEIDHIALKLIFQGQSEAAEKVLMTMYRDKKWEGNGFQFDLLMCFWLSVHMGNIYLLNKIMIFDVYLRQLVALAMKSKREKPKAWRKPERHDITQDIKTGASNIAVKQVFGEQLMKNKKASGMAQALMKNKKLGALGLEQQNEGGEEEDSQEEESDLNMVSSGRDQNAEEQKAIVNQTENVGNERDSMQWINPRLSRRSDELTPMMSQDQSGINFGHPEDSLCQKWKVGDVIVAPKIPFKANEQTEYMEYEGVTGLDIETIEIETEEEMERLKKNFRLNFPMLMTNILKILLFQREEALAKVLTAYYELSLSQEMIYQAIDWQQYGWLNYLWAFGKNYIGSRRGKGKQISMNAFFRSIRAMLKKRKEHLEAALKTVCDWKLEENVEKPNENNVLHALLQYYWDELCLKYMGIYKRNLKKELFVYALKNGNEYFIENSLLSSAFDQKDLLDQNVIDEMLKFFEDDGSKTNFILNVLLLLDISQWKIKSLDKLVGMFENYLEGSIQDNRLLLSYNPMMSIALAADLLTNIAKRKRFTDRCEGIKADLLELGRIYNEKIDEPAYYEQLIMDTDFKGRTVLSIICYSKLQPLMHEDDPKAVNLINNIWHGRQSEKCNGSTDGFSTLKHILESPTEKAEESATFMEIVTNFWGGINDEVDYLFQYRYRMESIKMYYTKECFFGCIILYFLIKISQDFQTEFKGPLTYVAVKNDTAGNEVVYSTETNGMYDFEVVLSNLQKQTTDEATRVENYKTAMEQFKDHYITVVFFCASMIYAFLSKILFKLCQKDRAELQLEKHNDTSGQKASGDKRPYKLPMDAWQVFDLITAVTTLVIFVFLSIQDPAKFIDQSWKNIYDALVIALSLMTCLRLVFFLLVYEHMSTLILTLQAMLKDTIPFIILLWLYIIMVSLLYCTLFQDINSGSYGDLKDSVITIFDGVNASYGYTGYGETWEIGHMALLILHVYLGNIVILNYLIAILSQSYCDILETGTFLYKVNLYKYCERYIIAMETPAYAELVKHPAPICVLNIPLFLMSLIPRFDKESGGNVEAFLKALSEGFQLFMFWLENFFLIPFFFMYSLMLVPFAYLVDFVTIIKCTTGVEDLESLQKNSYEEEKKQKACSGLCHKCKVILRTVKYLAWWFLTGPFILIFIACRDVYNFFRLLTMHQGCREAKGFLDEAEVDEVDEQLQVKVFEEVRLVVLETFYRIRNECAKKERQKEMDENEAIEDNEENEDGNPLELPFTTETSIKELLEQEEKLIGRNEEEFTVKTSEIHQLWLNKKAAAMKLKIEQQEKELADEKQVESEQADIAEEVQIQDEAAQSDHDQHSVKEEENQEENDDKGLQAFKEQLMKDKKEEDGLVKEMLERFQIASEESTKADRINIMLMLKAIPIEIIMQRLNQVKKFNFLYLQSALIAKSNADFVDAFEHYDGLNKHRVNNIKNTIIQQKKNLDECKENTDKLKDMIWNNENTLTEFTEMYVQYKIEKEIQERNQQAERQVSDDSENIEKKDKKGKKNKKGGKNR